jgi:6-phosphofructokinase 1
MANLLANAVVGQSGGPTSAINATLAGVIRGALNAQSEGKINTLYGMRNGIEGFLKEDFIDLCERFSGGKDLNTLATTPAAALGSCRKKLKDLDTDAELYRQVLDILKKHNIRYFFYIGGNDSMDTVMKLSQYAKRENYDMCVVGVPKTIDNDLMATDHTPGFGSAAKFVATTTKEILRDVSVYKMKAVTIVEIMGRDAGWLTASSALTKLSGGVSPDLVYLPECVFDTEEFIASINKAFETHPAVLVTVSEGIRFADGHYVGEGSGAVDAFGHKPLSGAGRVLEEIVRDRLGCKVRSIEFSLTQRCAGHILSKTDIDESLAVGQAAVENALLGKTGIMMTIERVDGDKYTSRVGVADISTIANEVRGVPREYINAAGNGITDAGLEYLAPLVVGEVSLEYENGLPKHIVL